MLCQWRIKGQYKRPLYYRYVSLLWLSLIHISLIWMLTKRVLVRDYPWRCRCTVVVGRNIYSNAVMHVKTVHGMIINNGLSAMRSRVPLFADLFRLSVRNYRATVCIVKSNLLWNSHQILRDFKFPLNSGYFQIAADRLASFISSNRQWCFLSIFRFTVMIHIVY